MNIIHYLWESLQEISYQTRKHFWLWIIIVEKLFGKSSIHVWHLKRFKRKYYNHHPHYRLLNIVFVQNFHFQLPVLASLVLHLLEAYSKSRDVIKCFILIFKSATSQFTYLKLSSKTTPVSFISFFKRFISRYGTSTNVVSDNVKSFKLNETENYFKEINVTWKPIL